MDGVKLTLDCAQAEFISNDRAVISLKGGELYVLSLIADAMRTVRGFHFDRAAGSVLTTCLCVCEENYLFLGSRLGNSLLLQFTEKDLENPAVLNAPKTEQPPLKKKKMETDWLASDVGDIHAEDLEVYGSRIDELNATPTSKIASYNFEVCDSILNIGPCGHMAMGQPAFLSDELQNSVKADPDVELVSTSGHGKNGALCVLQQTVRPQIVTTFELTGVNDMWTVIGKDSQVEDSGLGHAFLILARNDSTMILQTGQEINELDQSGFYTEGPTVYCGNIGDNQWIIQVGQKSIRLLDGIKLSQSLPLELGSPIVHVSSADPYLIALTEDGQLILISLDAKELSIVKANLKSKSKLVAACAYKDNSGLFTCETPEELEAENLGKQEEPRQETNVK